MNAGAELESLSSVHSLATFGRSVSERLSVVSDGLASLWHILALDYCAHGPQEVWTEFILRDPAKDHRVAAFAGPVSSSEGPGCQQRARKEGRKCSVSPTSAKPCRHDSPDPSESAREKTVIERSIRESLDPTAYAASTAVQLSGLLSCCERSFHPVPDPTLRKGYYLEGSHHSCRGPPLESTARQEVAEHDMRRGEVKSRHSI